jgi:hypothetical protein
MVKVYSTLTETLLPFPEGEEVDNKEVRNPSAETKPISHRAFDHLLKTKRL